MFKKLGISTLALAAVLAVAAPTASFARDRDDHRNDHRDRGSREVIVHRDHDRFGFGVGIVAPAAGYYDQFGVWHPYGFYDQFGVWHAY
jgi:hypothetical protein